MKTRNKGLKTFIIFAFIIIIILMLFMIKEFSQMKREGNKCISSPFVWGAQKVAKEEGSLLCSCITGSLISFSFNEDGMNNVQKGYVDERIR